MEIGKPERIVIVEPVEDPLQRPAPPPREPEPERERPPEPVEP